MGTQAEMTNTVDADADEAFWAALRAGRQKRSTQAVREAVGRRGSKCYLVVSFDGTSCLFPIAKDRARWLLAGLPGYARVWAAEVDDEEGDGVYLFADGAE